MRTHKDTLVWWMSMGAICFLSLSAVVFGQEAAVSKLDTLEQLSRIQIPVTGGSGFRMLSGKGGEVTLVIDRVATGALGSLPRMSDSRVKQITVKEIGLDRAEVNVQFREVGTESFAYTQGNSLVLDLWQGKAPTASKAPAAALPKEVKKPTAPKEEATAKNAAKSSARVPASGASSAAKAAAPAAEPLKIDRDLFQKFLLPMPDLVVVAKDGGVGIPPKLDIAGRWKFAKGNKETQDGKVFEFAKKLFAAKKYGLCLKTIEITLRDFPKTENRNELKLLRALAYQKLGETAKEDFLVNRSQKMLEELAAIRDEDGEPLPFARLIVLHFAQEELAAANWLRAIQHLEYVTSVTKASDADFPYVQIMLAESYSKVNQPRRAERLYRYLIEKFPKHVLARESYYRIADLLAIEKNYARVAEEGEAAIRAYPDHEKVRAEVLFQIGEAYFWLRQYAKAEKNFRRFLQIAGAQTIGSLAWVRIGEIEEVHRGNLRAAREAYLKAKNGYPFSKGDLVATVRLARIDLPVEKDPKFVVRTLEELLADKTVEWDVKRMAEITLADYLMLTGDVGKAIALASGGMAQADGSVYDLYKHTYEKGLFSQLAVLVEEKKYAEALALYERDKKWLDGYGPETFRALSEAYRGLGLFASANQLMEKYSTELARSGRRPSSAGAQAKVSREKALNSFARGAYGEVLEGVANQNDPQAAYLRAVSHYRMGHKKEAYQAVEKAFAFISAAPKGTYTDQQIEDIAEIQIEHDDLQRDFPKMEASVAKLRSLTAKEVERLEFAAADVLWYQKRHAEAEKAYKAALAQFPNGIRSDRARYNLGMSLLAQQKREEAVKLMTELKNSGQSVWSESAKQELELIEWEKKYSSVLRTLPPSGLGIAN